MSARVTIEYPGGATDQYILPCGYFVCYKPHEKFLTLRAQARKIEEGKMTPQERIERAEKELAEAKKMLEKENKPRTWRDLQPGTLFTFTLSRAPRLKLEGERYVRMTNGRVFCYPTMRSSDFEVIHRPEDAL